MDGNMLRKLKAEKDLGNYHAKVGVLRFLLEFWLSGSLRGHAQDSSKSVEKMVGIYI